MDSSSQSFATESEVSADDVKAAQFGDVSMPRSLQTDHSCVPNEFSTDLELHSFDSTEDTRKIFDLHTAENES